MFKKGKEKQIHERSKRNITLNAEGFFWVVCVTALSVEPMLSKLRRITAQNKLERAF